MGSGYHAHMGIGILSILSTLEWKLLGFQLQQIQTALRGQNQLIIFPTSQQFQKGGDIMKRSLLAKSKFMLWERKMKVWRKLITTYIPIYPTSPLRHSSRMITRF